MQQRTTTLPSVSAAQNGSGTSATRVERFDEFGRLEWSKDERGTISYREYDLASGNATQSIDDVDDSTLTVPSGWSTPTGGGKHLVTDFIRLARPRLSGEALRRRRGHGHDHAP